MMGERFSPERPDDRIIYDSATGNPFFDPDGIGGAAQIKFAVASAGLSMNEGEFRIS